MGQFFQFEKFVEDPEVSLALIATGFSDEEVMTATSAIRSERAQFVVDAAASELGRRALGLKERRNALSDEISQLDEELSVIDAALPPEQVDENIAEWEVRLRKITAANSWDEFISVIENEPPFVLWIKPNEDVDPYIWNEYACEH